MPFDDGFRPDDQKGGSSIRPKLRYCTQKSRSRFRRRGRAALRLMMTSCWRRAKFSMVRFTRRVKKALTKIHNGQYQCIGDSKKENHSRFAMETSLVVSSWHCYRTEFSGGTGLSEAVERNAGMNIAGFVISSAGPLTFHHLGYGLGSAEERAGSLRSRNSGSLSESLLIAFIISLVASITDAPGINLER